ncbi:MAG: hypothetical protein GXO88_11135 [Chlorobi bacterium]|nr:hypothetical protein [Chlorobiota bacterium]
MKGISAFLSGISVMLLYGSAITAQPGSGILTDSSHSFAHKQYANTAVAMPHKTRPVLNNGLVVCEENTDLLYLDSKASHPGKSPVHGLPPDTPGGVLLKRARRLGKGLRRG